MKVNQMNEMIYGKNVILAAIEAKRKVFHMYINQNQKEAMKDFIKVCSDRKIPCDFIESKAFDKKFQGSNQGIVAEVAPYEYRNLDDVIDKIKIKNELPFLIILDSLEDPHNLGAILRTVDAIGAHAVLIPKHRNVRLNGTVAKVSTGAIEYVDVVEITNINYTLNDLKKRGIWIVGAEAGSSINYFEQDYKMPLALVIGSEGKGISRLVKENCDFLVNIPMVGHVNSLNASVSAALLMYEVYKNRR
jgi:23S rRNA (guanosine2251-2'-O)-methyltransferase